MTTQTTAIDRAQPQAIGQTGNQPMNSPVSYRPNADVFETDDAFIISADYRNGVVIIHLPRRQEARPRRIEVRNG